MNAAANNGMRPTRNSAALKLDLVSGRVMHGVGRLPFIQSIEEGLSQIYDWRCFIVEE
jgi:hypothetical protein